MIQTIKDFAEHRKVRDWYNTTAKTVREEYQAAGYYPVDLGGLGRRYVCPGIFATNGE